jgi:glycine/D-amino acid oxidase-like deaminating enzyme
MKKVDYIIVGQGLAGTILSFQLIQNKQKVYVIDKGYKSSSSYVAAGLINPIVLKRITKTWRASEFIKYNDKFYDTFSLFLKGKYYKKAIFEKLIISDEEKQFWEHRYHEEDVSDFIERELIKSEPKLQYSNSFESGFVKKTAWLNIKPLLKDYRDYLEKNDMLLSSSINYDKIKFSDSEVIYNGVSAKKIIFCEGANIINNPFFNYLPMVLNKGELLTVKSESFNTSNILKKKVFVLPVEKDTFKIGATFDWKWDTENPTKEKKEQLENDFKVISKLPYKVINHESGVRPSSRDRRPIIGIHQENNKVGVFNGLGSRACFMAPLLSQEFIDYLNKKSPLNKEADIIRFKKFKLD